MDRTEFELLRDLPAKRISGDLRLTVKNNSSPVFEVTDVPIENSLNIDARITISFNPKAGSKKFNVHIPGVGPICRLCVDGTVHHPCGRSHKHSLRTPDCPDNNLPLQVLDRPDLSGQSLPVLFREFCRIAQIEHEGQLFDPSE